MSPRPILKSSSSASAACSPRPCPNYQQAQGMPAVHFPPSPSLSRTFAVHSSTTYDRSPIVVAPNSCALPERGCPGRTYTLEESSVLRPYPSVAAAPAFARGHVHPRALEQQVTTVPPLIPDLSSESEESDGFLSSPPIYNAPPRHYSSPSVSKYPPSHPAYDTLNHGVTSGYGSNTFYMSNSPPNLIPNYPIGADPAYQKARRRRRSPPSQDVEADDPGYDDDADIPPPSSSPLADRERRRGRRMPSSCKNLSSFSMHEDDGGGCLGGF